MPSARRADRLRRLRRFGATPATVETLLDYTEPLVPPPVDLPVADEPHVPMWRRFEADAGRLGTWPVLAAEFVQLRFPIRAGISQDPAYRAATRRGRFEEADAFAPGLALREPEGVRLDVSPSAGGRVPVITIANRDDFVSLVRAFTERNEPAPVPPALGACLVRGLNDWARVTAHRTTWRAEHPDAGDDDWSAELRRFAEDKTSYQDSLILLSAGPYADVGAADIGLDPADWLARSLAIRRAHELTHYFTYRVFGLVRSHLLDELIADFMGLRHAFGRYDPAVALRVLGLDEDAATLSGGRFAVYKTGVLEADDVAAVVRRLAVSAVTNLGVLDRRLGPAGSAAAQARLALDLFALALDELASDEGIETIAGSA